jgi:hypothetical protein
MNQELAGGEGMLVEAYDQRRFCEDACAWFPGLGVELRENSDSLHSLMGVLGRGRAARG